MGWLHETATDIEHLHILFGKPHNSLAICTKCYSTILHLHHFVNKSKIIAYTNKERLVDFVNVIFLLLVCEGKWTEVSLAIFSISLNFHSSSSSNFKKDIFGPAG